MTDHHSTIATHVLAASALSHATARDTVKATPSARKTLTHMDAAQSFMTAAEALYEAAELIAGGEATIGERLSLALRVAEHKATEGRWRLKAF
jgi:uncharacterized protein VirK/YbjX